MSSDSPALLRAVRGPVLGAFKGRMLENSSTACPNCLLRAVW